MVAYKFAWRRMARFTIVGCCAFLLHAQKPGTVRRTDWAASSDWPVYHGSSANIKYSTLDQVNPPTSAISVRYGVTRPPRLRTPIRRT
jgi:hypothetical protein